LLFPARRELESPQHKLAIIDEAAKKHEEVIYSALHGQICNEIFYYLVILSSLQTPLIFAGG